jgi:hypothetical protein
MSIFRKFLVKLFKLKRKSNKRKIGSILDYPLQRMTASEYNKYPQLCVNERILYELKHPNDFVRSASWKRIRLRDIMECD